MKKILIADDDLEVRTTLSELLEIAGYYTEIAVSGREAIKKAADEDFDVVLLDLVMPDMSGIEALTELKRIRPKAKVIMISGFATIANAVDAMKKGASDYIDKPYKKDELLIAVRRALEEKKFDQEIKALNLERALFSLSNPIRRNIVTALKSEPNKHFMEITRELGIEDHTRIVFHLKTLKDAGVVEQDEGKSYSLTKGGEKILEFIRILEGYFSE
ncbi:MAG: response regulator [Nitrospirae bacterium]|nr:MAG: response regulator [Nitrospirota bacterium]